MKPFQHGFIVGKFMPLHRGHQFLIDTALAECAQVTVLLISQPDESISGVVRLEWLEQLYPQCNIAHLSTPLPKDKTGYDHWAVWLTAIKDICPQQFDAVFSSEPYGERLATDFDATHRLVDQARTLVPVSGTMIRQNPAQHFQYLPGIVQLYYENQN